MAKSPHPRVNAVAVAEFAEAQVRLLEAARCGLETLAFRNQQDYRGQLHLAGCEHLAHPNADGHPQSFHRLNSDVFGFAQRTQFCWWDGGDRNERLERPISKVACSVCNIQACRFG